MSLTAASPVDHPCDTHCIVFFTWCNKAPLASSKRPAPSVSILVLQVCRRQGATVSQHAARLLVLARTSAMGCSSPSNGAAALAATATAAATGAATIEPTSAATTTAATARRAATANDSRSGGQRTGITPPAGAVRNTSMHNRQCTWRVTLAHSRCGKTTTCGQIEAPATVAVTITVTVIGVVIESAPSSNNT
jgi:hypothetical protein